MRTKAEVLQHFDTLATDGRWSGLYDDHGDAVTNYSFIVRRRRVEELLEPVIRADSRVLDIGCGTGVMAPFVLEAGAHYYGVDLSESMIAEARRRTGDVRASHGGSVEFSVGDVEDIRVPDAHFDVVMALGLLEYLHDVNPAIDELMRTTKPGGTIIVSVPNTLCADAVACRVFSPFVTTAARAVRRLMGAPRPSDDFSHRKFRPGDLDRLFTSRGCRKSGEAHYNLEIAFYPFRRVWPTQSLRIKARAEQHPTGVLRPFATAYIGRYITKHPMPP